MQELLTKLAKKYGLQLPLCDSVPYWDVNPIQEANERMDFYGEQQATIDNLTAWYDDSETLFSIIVADGKVFVGEWGGGTPDAMKLVETITL